MFRRIPSAIVLCLFLAIVSIWAVAADKPIGLTRVEGLLQALDASQEERRAFIAENFAPKRLEKNGGEDLIAFFDRLREDIGDEPPLSITPKPDRVEVRVAAPSGDRMLLTVLLSPAPESKIAGFLLDADEPPPAPVAAVSEADLPDAIAEAMAERNTDFSGAVIVAKDGKPIFAQAYGFADRAKQRRNTLDTPFNLASNNKMFTALVIARLAEQGKLQYEDKVGRFLPDWPQADVRDKVSIAHLLNHSSGLGEFWGPKYAERRGELDTVAEYAQLFSDEAPASTPGQEFRYSNNGYVLLGLIAERITGKDYYQLVRETVYGPAGMSRSEHYANADEGSGRAVGYLRDGEANTGGLALRGSPAGGGYASANDLLKFSAALQAGRIVKPETLARMTRGDIEMGPDMKYGFGFGVSEGKEKHYGHDGGAPGINASFEVFPESGYAVIVLSNLDRGSQATAQHLGSMILARR
ncbi:serine hydrolase domain-containing protein [Arenimonas sp.]|uniref:serine hydrolase domain-containing protein n=1 Tax=Arenimonas sp. TaxID=1872635 RepID=UPI0039E549FF